MLFKQAFDQRFQFMAVLDPTGQVLEVNGAPDRLGLDRGAFVGRHLAATPSFEADPNWRLTWDTRLFEAAQAGHALTYEDVFTGPQGETRSADAVLTPVFGADQQIEYFIVEAEDTTARMQVELALRESERRFHDLAESLPVMAWSSEAAGSCDYLNGRWLDYTGAAPGQHHGWSWIDAIHPEDRPGFAFVWMAALRDGAPAEAEYRVRRYDGEYRWFDIRVVPVHGQEQQVTRWYGTASDVHEAHELRESLAERETQLSSALVAGSMARWAFDLESRRFTSDPFLSDLIHVPPDFLAKAGIEGWAELIHPDDRAEWRRGLVESFNPETPDFSNRYRLLSGEERTQWIGSRGRVEFDENGKPRKIAGVVFALPGAGPVDPRDCGAQAYGEADYAGSMQDTTSRQYDLVLFGATGFVGKLTAAYLAEHAPKGTRIALAGRSTARLEAVRHALPAAASDWSLIQADSFDVASLAALAADTRVVVTTVGPYATYGLPLVEACAEAGTHYADLTGEVLFMRRSIDTAHARAKATGARIVHTCGFDSIPSDLGVLALHEYAAEIGAGDLENTNYVVTLAGGISGGTIDSMRQQLAAVRADKSVLKVLLSPYSLTPERDVEPDLGKQRDPQSVTKDPITGDFLAPFVMGAVNTRVVRRSNALQGYAYGRTLKYQEYMRGGSGPVGAAKAGAVLVVLGALVGGLTLGPTRKLLDKVLPKPGEGPSVKAQDNGFFKVDITASTSSGKKIRCRIKASGDPGYKATAVMLGEAGLCLALDQGELPDAAGVLTPATAMGSVLTERLRAAGHVYELQTL